MVPYHFCNTLPRRVLRYQYLVGHLTRCIEMRVLPDQGEVLRVRSPTAMMALVTTYRGVSVPSCLPCHVSTIQPILCCVTSFLGCLVQIANFQSWGYKAISGEVLNETCTSMTRPSLRPAPTTAGPSAPQSRLPAFRFTHGPVGCGLPRRVRHPFYCPASAPPLPLAS